jgi:geranylgeranyl diphosphate synthase type I
VLAGCSESELALLENIGEKLGIIFQLKDDELGVFGEEITIGKPAGSDIREDKKTLFRYYLLKQAFGVDLRQVERIYGKEDITHGDLQALREISQSLGVQKKIDMLMQEYAEKARVQIDDLDETAALKPLLHNLLDYSLVRVS